MPNALAVVVAALQILLEIDGQLVQVTGHSRSPEFGAATEKHVGIHVSRAVRVQQSEEQIQICKRDPQHFQAVPYLGWQTMTP